MEDLIHAAKSIERVRTVPAWYIKSEHAQVRRAVYNSLSMLMKRMSAQMKLSFPQQTMVNMIKLAEYKLLCASTSQADYSDQSTLMTRLFASNKR